MAEEPGKRITRLFLAYGDPGLGPKRVMFMQGVLDDGSALPPVGSPEGCTDLVELATQGCFTMVSERWAASATAAFTCPSMAQHVANMNQMNNADNEQQFPLLFVQVSANRCCNTLLRWMVQPVQLCLPRAEPMPLDSEIVLATATATGFVPRSGGILRPTPFCSRWVTLALVRGGGGGGACTMEGCSIVQAAIASWDTWLR